MNILKRLLRIQMVRNIGGAATGAVIAITLYGIYGVGHSVVASMLPVHTVTDTHAEDAARAAKLMEVGARAKAIAEELH